MAAGDPRPPRLLVVGLGLIGGSVALAARERLGAEVCGTDEDPEAVRRAGELGIGPPLPGSQDPDIVLVATPVPALAGAIAAAIEQYPAAAVTDAGSTKSLLAGAGFGPRYVGGHPLAGAEVAGVGHARADLFAGSTWFLTPRSDSEGLVLERIHRFVAGIGASPVVIDAGEHDRLMSAFSHLPHVLANILALRAEQVLAGDRRPVVGPSFRDATRVAGANPVIWPGIYAANRDALLADIDAAADALSAVRALIERADEDGLAGWQRQAATARDALAGTGAGGSESCELRVIVPNRPGVLAELALTLARAQVNIQDLSLVPAPDNRSGAVALWVPRADAGRARALIDEVAGR